jgi:hypothetical protein
MTAEVAGRYPLSSSAGQSIPMDVIRPKGLYYLALTANVATSSFELDHPNSIYTLFSDVDSIVQFAGSSTAASALTPGTLKSDALLLMNNMILTVSNPVDMNWISFFPLDTGGVYIQVHEAWSGMTSLNSLIRR